MHFQRSATAAAAAVIALAGCSANGSSLPANSATSIAPSRMVSIDELAPPMAARRFALRFVDPAKAAANMYVSAYNASGSTPVNDYAANNSKNKGPLCQVTAVGQGINAIEVDATSNLWVPQGLDPKSGQPDVVSFAPNCGKAGTILTGLKGQPSSISWAPDGTRYVDEILGASSSAGDVAVFPKGKKKPTRYLTDPSWFLVTGAGANSAGDVYVGYYTASSVTGMMLFSKGQMPGKPVKNFTNGAPGTIVFDSKDNMIVTDDAAVTIDIYAKPYTKKPKTFPMQGHSPECSLDKAETNLACGDKTNNTVDIYTYPAGKYQYSFDKGLTPTVIGVAQDPP